MIPLVRKVDGILPLPLPCLNESARHAETPVHPMLRLPPSARARFSLPALALTTLALLLPAQAAEWKMQEAPMGLPNPRHEAAFVELAGKFYLVGGRRIQPVDIFDPATNTWTNGAAPMAEVHHFQAIPYENKIWVVGALTGGRVGGTAMPETALGRILIYDPATDAWSRGPLMPEGRRRGSAGAVIYQDTLYVLAGVTVGHRGDNVTWFDALDLKTGQWRQLPDAPRTRDHFQAAVVGDKFYAAGGRRSDKQGELVAEVDVFDFKTGQWSTLPSPGGDLPTTRAGTMTFAVGPMLIVAGGETQRQEEAHNEVEALDTRTGVWTSWPKFLQGRHGTSLLRHGSAIYVGSGAPKRGILGIPEVGTIEKLELPAELR